MKALYSRIFVVTFLMLLVVSCGKKSGNGAGGSSTVIDPNIPEDAGVVVSDTYPSNPAESVGIVLDTGSTTVPVIIDPELSVLPSEDGTQIVVIINPDEEGLDLPEESTEQPDLSSEPTTEPDLVVEESVEPSVPVINPDLILEDLNEGNLPLLKTKLQRRIASLEKKLIILQKQERGAGNQKVIEKTLEEMATLLGLLESL